MLTLEFGGRVGVGIYQGKILLYTIAVELKTIKSPKNQELGIEKTSVVGTRSLKVVDVFCKKP
jgi:hypothetical protein